MTRITEEGEKRKVQENKHKVKETKRDEMKMLGSEGKNREGKRRNQTGGEGKGRLGTGRKGNRTKQRDNSVTSECFL